VGTATYDCCYGEIPESIQHFVVTRAGGNWRLAEFTEPRLDHMVMGDGAIGTGYGRVWRSDDLVGWSWETVDAPVDSRAVDYARGRFVVGSIGGFAGQNRGHAALYSSEDGLNWFAATVDE
jgi:hypothetical protein